MQRVTGEHQPLGSVHVHTCMHACTHPSPHGKHTYSRCTSPYRNELRNQLRGQWGLLDSAGQIYIPSRSNAKAYNLVVRQWGQGVVVLDVGF